MNVSTSTESIATLDHDEAMTLAATEYDRVLSLLDNLDDSDWPRATDCAGWDVRATVGHLLGMFELLADADEAKRQGKLSAVAAAASGGIGLHELTALQVREHADLTIVELLAALRDAARRALAARQATTAEQRLAPYHTTLPGEGAWTVGYLLDVIHTRDPWMHRVDICRAVGREVNLCAAHDGRVVADIVAEWSGRHQRAFTLNLTGPAGGSYRAGSDGPRLELDAVEFCRILSGRAPGAGLLATSVPF
jgi:uncharacterized protein (TIGR03083 family)